MAVIYEELNPSPIANITVIKGIVDGVHKNYRLTPNEGYVLHDNMLDTEEIDPETLEPTGNIILGFYAGTRSVPASYNFTVNPREFYAVLENEVPGNSMIFNVEPDHEIMSEQDETETM